MIYGIGTDICDIRRIEKSLNRYGERFAERILGAEELQVWRTRTLRWPARGSRYLATRFSAKEAFSKAIGLGMIGPMTWRRCEILNDASGRPGISLHGPLQDWFLQRKLQAHVSVSDESDYAATFVVVETLA